MSDKRVGDASGWRRFLSSKDLCEAYPDADETDFIWESDPPVAWTGVSSNPTVIRASGAAAQAPMSGLVASGFFSTPFGPVDAADIAWNTFCDIVRGLNVQLATNSFDPAAHYAIRKAFDTAIEPWVRTQPASDGEAGLSDVFEWLMAHHSPSKQDIAAALLKDYIIQKRKDTGL